MGITGAHLQSLLAAFRAARTPPRAEASEVHGRRGRPGDGHLMEWRSTLRSRILIAAGCLALWTTAIEARLVYLQVVAHEDFMTRADRQQLRTVTPPAKRGDIFDRKGRLLAYSVDADTIASVPNAIDNPADVAARVCAALDGCNSERRQQFAKTLSKRAPFAYVARQVTPDEARRVKALGLPGIMLLKESRRYYPNSELAAHVIGYVGIDNVGLGGIESAYDSQIRGRAGKVLLQTDNLRNAMFSRVETPPTAGADIELTLDQYLQYVAERELRTGVEENRAEGGTAIVMDPWTGEILALANWPTFNPNAFGRVDDDVRRNRAIQTLYEPGSTFKIVTASAALERKVITPDSLIETSPGFITFPGRKPIYDTHHYGTLAFTDVIVKSSNVGAIKVGLKVGPDVLTQYVNRFGFGQTLGPDFKGETAGIVWSADRLDASALASVSMGYQVGVTPLQMASAVSSVANGGHLFQPRVVRAFIKEGRRVDVPAKEMRRTIEADTAATVTTIMEQVVERGTAKAAQIEGFTIAGKTGTAAKLVNGHYQTSDYNASFVGFIPSRKPRLTILVVIDSPHAKGHTGGAVSAPVFKRIAEAAVTYLGIPPNLNPPPPVLVARRDVDADGDAVPQPTRTAAILSATVEPARNGLMPDLRGLSAREALRLLSKIGLTARMSGDGFVIDQLPLPGAAVLRGETSTLKLGRRFAAAGGQP
jgi:cell division protein FtsI (penicillin-binding protein 3)